MKAPEYAEVYRELTASVRAAWPEIPAPGADDYQQLYSSVQALDKKVLERFTENKDAALAVIAIGQCADHPSVTPGPKAG